MSIKFFGLQLRSYIIFIYLWRALKAYKLSEQLTFWVVAVLKTDRIQMWSRITMWGMKLIQNGYFRDIFSGRTGLSLVGAVSYFWNKIWATEMLKIYFNQKHHLKTYRFDRVISSYKSSLEMRLIVLPCIKNTASHLTPASWQHLEHFIWDKSFLFRNTSENVWKSVSLPIPHLLFVSIYIEKVFEKTS